MNHPHPAPIISDTPNPHLIEEKQRDDREENDLCRNYNEFLEHGLQTILQCEEPQHVVTRPKTREGLRPHAGSTKTGTRRSRAGKSERSHYTLFGNEETSANDNVINVSRTVKLWDMDELPPEFNKYVLSENDLYEKTCTLRSHM